MILLDTNIVSEVMKVAPSETVLDWLNREESSSLYVSAVTIGEIAYGLHILPDGKRRLRLNEKFEQFIALAFAQRILDYDEPAARVYGEIMGSRKELGRPMSAPDGQIAAIARVNELVIVTANVKDFRRFEGLEVANWFR